MVEAEAVCSRALQRSPLCVKALFRRGQARLALGRLQEADIDFRQVADLEPTNTNVGRMLQRVEEEKICRSTTFSHTSSKGQRGGSHHEEGKPSPRVRLSSTEIDDSSSKINSIRQTLRSPPRIELPYRSDCPSEMDIIDKSETTCVKMIAERRGTTPSAIAQGIDHSLEHVEVDPEKLDFPLATTVDTDTPGFMVPGWLNSVERQNADQKRRNEYNQDNIPSGDASPWNLLTAPCGSVAEESARNDSTVTPLVSKLRERRTSRSRHMQSRGACTVTQSEWVRLQTEENKKLDILKERSALLSRSKKCTKGSGQRGRSQEQAYSESKAGQGTAATGQSTQAFEWKMLEKKERELRSAFRAKLAIGEKKRKNVISQLRTRAPSQKILRTQSGTASM